VDRRIKDVVDRKVEDGEHNKGQGVTDSKGEVRARWEGDSRQRSMFLSFVIWFSNSFLGDTLDGR
jgi:hypothetical protein